MEDTHLRSHFRWKDSVHVRHLKSDPGRVVEDADELGLGVSRGILDCSLDDLADNTVSEEGLRVCEKPRPGDMGRKGR